LPLLALMAGCLCETTSISRARSPDGQLEALVSSTDCGATTRFAYTVTLQNASWFHRVVHRATPVFDVDDTTTVTVPYDTLPALGIQPRWISNKALLIKYYSGARVYLRDTLVDGVAIHFEVSP